MRAGLCLLLRVRSSLLAGGSLWGTLGMWPSHVLSRGGRTKLDTRRAWPHVGQYWSREAPGGGTEHGHRKWMCPQEQNL